MKHCSNIVLCITEHIFVRGVSYRFPSPKLILKQYILLLNSSCFSVLKALYNRSFVPSLFIRAEVHSVFLLRTLNNFFVSQWRRLYTFFSTKSKGHFIFFIKFYNSGTQSFCNHQQHQIGLNKEKIKSYTNIKLFKARF